VIGFLGAFFAAPQTVRADTAGYSGNGVVNNGYVAAGLNFIADLQFSPGSAPVGSNGGLYSAAIDTTTGYALFGSIKGDMTKVKLGVGAATPTVVGMTNSLNDGFPGKGGLTISSLTNMVIDTRSADLSQHYAYVAGNTGSGNNTTCYLMKVQMFPQGNLQAAPKVVGLITLPIPSAITQSPIDLVNGYIYFTTFQSGTLVQLNLNDNTIKSVTGLPANLNYWQMRLANNILYVSDPTQITRVKLDANGALPASLNAGNLDSLPSPGTTTFYADTDPAHPYAYGAMFTVDPNHQSTSVPAIFTRYNIGSGTMSQGPTSTLYLPNAQNPVTSFYVSLGGIDPDSHYLLMGTDNALPGSVSKIAGEASAGPAVAGVVVLREHNAKQPWPYSDGDLNIRSTLIDATTGYAYFGTDTGVSNSIGTRMLKVQYSQKGSIKGNRIALPAGSSLTSVNLFANMPAVSGSASSSGNARLAIYSDNAGSPGTVLWQSGDVDLKSVPVGGGWITASNSALTSLTIAGGNYWLAWQVDTTCDVPAYAGTGAAGIGFAISQPYGAFGNLAGVATTPTTDLWQMNVTYTPPTGLVLFRSANGLAADGSQDALEPAGDGVASLFKYAFNMIGSGTGQAASLSIPNDTPVGSGGIAGLPAMGLDASGRLTIACIRRKLSASPASGITYAFEFSGDLSAGSWAVNAAATETTTGIDATYERVVVTDSMVNPPKRFGRVKITNP